MRVTKAILALVLIILAPIAYATDYYACDCQAGAAGTCSAGSDASAGTSTGSAWQTATKLFDQVTLSSCGDTFNLCTGGVFHITASLSITDTDNCSSNRRIIRTYVQNGSAQRPSVQGATTSTRQSGLLLSGGINGLTIQDFDLKMTCPLDMDLVNSNITGIQINTGTPSNITLDNIKVSHFRNGMDYNGSGHTNIDLTNSTIFDNTNMGYIGTCTGGACNFTGNTFDGNGCRAQDACGQEHALYFGGHTTDAVGNTFSGNIFTNNVERGGTCWYNSVTIRGGNQLVFEGNTIDARDDGEDQAIGNCDALTFNENQFATNDEGCLDCTVRNNVILDADYGPRFEGSKNLILENNVVILADDDANNIVCFGLAINSRSGDPNDQQADNNTVRNNSIYLTGHPSAGGCRGISITSEGSTHKVYSNAVYLNGVWTGSACYSYVAGTPNLTEDYNLCYITGTGNYAEFAYSGSSLASTRTTLGGCPASGNACDSQLIDPEFLNPAGYDLTINSSSNAYNAGSPTSGEHSTTDLLGVARPQFTSYDAGAYEFGTSLPGNLRGGGLRGGSIR